MSAIDNKHKLEILSVIVEEGISKKPPYNPWIMHKAQCVFHGSDKGVQVGLMLLPKDLKDTPPGSYLAEFELGVNYKLEVVPLVTALHPHGKSSAPAPAPQKQVV